MSTPLRGLAAYPGEYCYDAARPSLLPYWIDDFTEMACDIKGAPQTIATCLNPLSSGCDPNSLINLNISSQTPNTDPTVSGAGVAAPGSANNAVCGSFQTANAAGVCVFDPTQPGFILLVLGVGIALISFFKK